MNDQSFLARHGTAAAGKRGHSGVRLGGRAILVVQGSLLAGDELAHAFEQHGARVHLTGTCINAFDILRRMQFDGAVIDQGLHNAAFDLCYELRDLSVPHICSAVPHRLHKRSAQRRDAIKTVWRMADAMSKEEQLRDTCAAIPRPRHETLAAVGS